jgi:hypothetical protein
MITDTKAGTLPARQSACSRAEAREFEPRMGANPNRISSMGRGPEAGAWRGKLPTSAQVSTGAAGKAAKPGISQRSPFRVITVASHGGAR